MLPFKLNFKHSPQDSRDHIFQIVATSTSPTIDLSSFCSSIKNQGSVGSCTAHAGVGLMEFFYRKFIDGKENDVFSEKFVYYTTRVDIAGWPANEDSGAYLRDTMKSLIKFGSALEKTCPYLKENETACNFGEVPSSIMYEEAINYQVNAYANILEDDRPKCLNDLKAILQQGIAFVGGFYCYENIFSSNNGVIPMPSGSIIGGHAILFVGYNDTTQLFKFKNSWSELWGEGGYGYLPYAYVLNGWAFDFWTIYKQEYNNTVYGIVKPQNRAEEFDRRLKEILGFVVSGHDYNFIVSNVCSNTNNSLIFASDVRELLNFSARLNSLIINTKNASFRRL